MPAPANDNIANAITISGASGSSSTITMDDATRESGEPEPIGAGSMPKSVWFKFTPTASGTATFDTEGSRASDAPSGDGEPVGSFGHLDTQLAVYNTSGGSSFGALGLLSSNDDYAGDPDGLWSFISMSVTEGVTYYVQVGTYDESYNGTIGFSWTLPVADEGDGCNFPVVVGFNIASGIGASGLTADNTAFFPVAGNLWAVLIAVAASDVVFDVPAGYTLHASGSFGGVSLAILMHMVTGTEGAPAFTWTGAGDAILANVLLEPWFAGPELEWDGLGEAGGVSVTEQDTSNIDPYWGDESCTSYLLVTASSGEFSNFTTDETGLNELFSRDTNADLHVDTLTMAAWSIGRLSPDDNPGSDDPGVIGWDVARDRITFGFGYRERGPAAAYWGTNMTLTVTV